MGFLSIFHIYKLLFLGSDGLADNYPYINGANSKFKGCCLTIIHIYTVLFLGSEGLPVNYPYIHCAISRFTGVG